MTHVIFCKLLYGGFILGESESVYTTVFSQAGELFVSLAYHSIDDY